MSYLDTLKDKRIGVLGLGVTGLSCVSFLKKHGITPFVMDGKLDAKGVIEAQKQWPDKSKCTASKATAMYCQKPTC